MPAPPNPGKWTESNKTPGDSRTRGDGEGVFVIHATLLHTGEVLWFSGHAEVVHYLTESYVWDPTQPVSSAKRYEFPKDVDIFCCHQSVLEDGRILTVGGAAAAPDHGYGVKHICVFDPLNPGWVKIGEMNVGRWYPTLVTLPDGQRVAFSGRREVGAPSAQFIAPSVELFPPPFEQPAYRPRTLSGADRFLPTYPSVHMVPGGTLYYTGATWRYESMVDTPPSTASFRVVGSSAGVWTDLPNQPAIPFREEGTAVLLPPAQSGKILVLGGAKAFTSDPNFTVFDHLHPNSAPKSAEILDTQASPPTWTRVADMANARINVSAVLLPDGKVLVLGGHDRFKWDRTSTPSNQAELFDPTDNKFYPLAEMHDSRTYHSASLLLPDGRVLCAGGVDPTRSEPGAGALNQKTYEFYEPPYCSIGPRPVITAIDSLDGQTDPHLYGTRLVIATAEPDAIRDVVLMRLGAMTHHTDSEQRHVPLTFTREPGRLVATLVTDPTVAPPGYYMLFIVDTSGRPCERARFIRLGRLAPPEVFVRDALDDAGWVGSVAWGGRSPDLIVAPSAVTDPAVTFADPDDPRDGDLARVRVASQVYVRVHNATGAPLDADVRVFAVAPETASQVATWILLPPPATVTDIPARGWKFADPVPWTPSLPPGPTAPQRRFTLLMAVITRPGRPPLATASVQDLATFWELLRGSQLVAARPVRVQP